MLAPRSVKRRATAKQRQASEVTDTASAAFAGVASRTDEASEACNENSDNCDVVHSSVESSADTPQAVGDIEQTAGAAETKINIDEEKPTASTSESQPPSEDDKTSKQEKLRLDLLRFTIEECLSDWGLSFQHPELLQKFKDSKTGYIRISNLLLLPTLSYRASSMVDITAAMTAETSDTVELDSTGLEIRRRVPPDYDELSKLSVETWAERTLYLENVPKPPKGTSYTLDSLRKFLSKLLDSPIDALRLPPLFHVPVRHNDPSHNPSGNIKEKEDRNDLNISQTQEPANEAILRFDAPASDAGKPLHQYAIPQNGGPFKGFAFAVVNDGIKASQAKERWCWDTKGKRVAPPDIEEAEMVETADSDSEHSEMSVEETVDPDSAQPVDAGASTSTHPADLHQGTKSAKCAATLLSAEKSDPHQLAIRSGLCIMPIERFNRLRLEYLRYSADITVLKEKQDALHDNSFSKRQQRRSQSPGHSRHRRRSPFPEKWERKARSPSPEKWERKPLSPLRDKRGTRRYDDANNDDHPRGCVCFIKRLHPEARGGILKALFQEILAVEEVCPKDYLQHVDHKRNVDSCHVRFKDAATASFLASYFSGNPKYSHVDPTSKDPNEAFAMVKKGETTRPIEAEVITGIPEAIYWSTVPKAVKKACSGSMEGAEAVVTEAEEQIATQTATVKTEPMIAAASSGDAADAMTTKKRSLDSSAIDTTEGGDNQKSQKQPRLESA